MKLKNILIGLFVVTAFTACKKNDFMYYNGDNYIYFGPTPDKIQVNSGLSDTIQSYSFFYDEASVTNAQVKFNLYVTGGPRDFDRSFTIEQINVEDGINAVSGVNYKAFNSDEMKKVYVMKAGATHFEVPIMLIRSADLNSYVLKFRVVSNDSFVTSEEFPLWRKVYFTSALQKPDTWTANNAKWYFGKYSRTKHEWMINQTGFRWDDTFISELLKTDAIEYWASTLKRKLKEVNKERESNNLDPLEDEDGDEMAFGSTN